jgi:hypothetical protein
LRGVSIEVADHEGALIRIFMNPGS